MGLWSLLLGNSFVDGQQASDVYDHESGGQAASDTTVYSIAYDTDQEEPDRFHEGWRDADDNRKSFWTWITGK